MAEKSKSQRSKPTSQEASTVGAQKQESASQGNAGINDSITVADLSSSSSPRQFGSVSVRVPTAPAASNPLEQSTSSDPAGLPPKPNVQLPGQQQPVPTTEIVSKPSNSPPVLKSARHQRALEILSRPRYTPLATLNGPYELRRLLLRELDIARAQERARRESTPPPDTPIDREARPSDGVEKAEKEKRNL